MSFHPVVSAAVSLIDYLAVLSNREMTVSVADTERYIVNVPGERLKLGIHPGDPIKKGSIADIALQEGTRQIRIIPKEVFGVPFVGVGVPLKDENEKIVGLILTGTPIEDQEKVREMADNLAVAAEQIAATTQSLAGHSQELAATTQQVGNQAETMKSEIQRLDEIVRMVKGITNRTNILGLNASIEAARAGTYGRGFTVVAEEIRKMASDTNHSTQEISTTLLEIQEMLEDIFYKIENLSDLFQGQLAATEEIASSTQEVGNMACTLKGLASNLA